MLKIGLLVALTVGVSACGDSKRTLRPDSGARDGEEAFQDATLAAPNSVDSVRFTVAYGECMGFCQHSLLVWPEGTSLHFAPNIANDIPAVDETIALEPAVRTQILAAAAQALTEPWDARYGCPDCMDQGAYQLEVSFNGTIRKTVLDPQQHPALFDSLLADLEDVMTSHPAPNSICAVAPRDCTVGQVSLVLSLGKDGELTPSWYNDMDYTIFLPGCSTVTFERLDNGTVAWSGPTVLCGWEGIARMLGPFSLFSDHSLDTTDAPGTYRATGSFSEGCTSGVPLTQAACTVRTPITSNTVVVPEISARP